jgi:hypothetical protein
MGTVRVTIRNQATGAEVPARIAGSASDGKLYAPTTAFVFNARLTGGLKRIFHTSGSYVVEVPPGRLTLEVSKGFEYEPVTKEVMVRAGDTMDVAIPMRHRIDLSAQGWVNGSTHSHMNYGGNFHNTPPYFLSMARAEGLQIVSSLVANKDNRILDWQYFRKGGEVDPASNLAGKSMLIFGEENRPPLWGHMSYIGLSDHLISPFLNAYAGTAVDSLYPSNTDLFTKARARRRDLLRACIRRGNRPARRQPGRGERLCGRRCLGTGRYARMVNCFAGFIDSALPRLEQRLSRRSRGRRRHGG